MRWRRLLLWVLAPVFLCSVVLHTREIVRSGLAYPPVFASPAASAETHPTVGGLRMERGIDWNDLQPGDRLLQVGEIDLRGAGYFSFDAIVMEQAGDALSVPLVFERSGERHRTLLVLQRFEIPWFRLACILPWVLTGLIVLLRAEDRVQAQWFMAATLGFGIFQLPFQGIDRLQTYTYLALFNFGGCLAVALFLRWLISFPTEMAAGRRLPVAVCSLGALHLLARFDYIFGGPLPTEWIPAIVLVTDAVFIAAGLGIVTWNYLHALPIGRWRVKWFLYFGYVGFLPLAFSALASGIGGVPDSFGRTFEYGLLVVGLLPPAGILIGLVRHDLFDVDWLISATAPLSVAAAAGVVVGVGLAPGLSAAVSRLADVDPRATESLLALTVVAGVVPASRWLRPRFDRVLFPGSLVRERVIDTLLRDLSVCNTKADVIEVTTAGFRSAFALRGFRCFAVRSESSDLPGSRLPVTAELAFLVADLERDPAPRKVSGLTEGMPDVEVWVPIRQGKDLVVLVALGEKGSGDLYTPTDLTLIGAVAEKASSELLRIDGRAEIERERARAEEMRALKEEADRANRAKSRFLAAASHDLRQPLHALGLFVEALSAIPQAEEARPLAEKIRASTKSLREMFDALLDISRIEAGSVEPRLTDFALSPVLCRLRAELQPIAEAKGLRLVCEDTPCRVRSDVQLLGRILQNLLVNAIRYTEHGEVRVTTRRDGDAIEIAVEDTGCGIPEEKREVIFEEFVRLDGGSAGGSMGLGLAIVDRIVRILGHSLALESEVGVGTRFTLRLPAALSEPAALGSTGRSALGAVALDGRLVVVIDDDPSVLDGMRTVLARWGCDVVSAASASDAIDRIQARGRLPDAILADYALGDSATGIEAIAALRAFAGREIPAAVVTAETERAEHDRIRQSELPLASKPLPAYKLRALVQQLVTATEPI